MSEKWARGLYPFAGGAANQLSFNPGDEIKIIPGGELGDWLTGELNGAQGIIPSNYVQIFEKAVAPGAFGRIYHLRPDRLLG